MEDFKRKIEKTIIAADQLYTLVNGNANTKIQVADGSQVMSLRGVLASTFQFKNPINWVEGEYETEFNQLRIFTDGSWWVAPTASPTTKVLMGTNPKLNPAWKFISYDRVEDSQKALKYFITKMFKEVGYNLVFGSFQEGATILNSNDAIICYGAEPKVYKYVGQLPFIITPQNSEVNPNLFVEITDLHISKQTAHTISQISGLSLKLQALETADTNLNLSVTNLNSDVANLNTVTASLDSEVNNLGIRVTSLEGVDVAILSNQAGLATLAGFSGGLETVSVSMPTTLTVGLSTIIANPFNNNTPVAVSVVAELETGIWGFINKGTVYGSDCTFVKGVGLVLKVGSSGIMAKDNSIGVTKDVKTARYVLVVKKLDK